MAVLDRPFLLASDGTWRFSKTIAGLFLPVVLLLLSCGCSRSANSASANTARPVPVHFYTVV